MQSTNLKNFNLILILLGYGCILCLICLYMFYLELTALKKGWFV